MEYTEDDIRMFRIFKRQEQDREDLRAYLIIRDSIEDTIEQYKAIEKPSEEQRRRHFGFVFMKVKTLLKMLKRQRKDHRADSFGLSDKIDLLRNKIDEVFPVESVDSGVKDISPKGRGRIIADKLNKYNKK